MPEFISFSFNDLEKVGFHCPNCDSEIVLTIDKVDTGKRLSNDCPACYAKDARGAIVPAAIPFSRAGSVLAKIRDLKGEAEGIRLYFKKD